MRRPAGSAPTVEDVREIATALPRTTEALVRDRVKFRVGRIVYLALSRDETLLGFAFPKDERDALWRWKDVERAECGGADRVGKQRVVFGAAASVKADARGARRRRSSPDARISGDSAARAQDEARSFPLDRLPSCFGSLHGSLPQPSANVE